VWLPSPRRASAKPPQGLLTTQIDQRFQHLAFQSLHKLHGYIEKIAGAAGGIEHARFAQSFTLLPTLRALPASNESLGSFSRKSTPGRIGAAEIVAGFATEVVVAACCL
jgi:hypothetical protein